MISAIWNVFQNAITAAILGLRVGNPMRAWIPGDREKPKVVMDGGQGYDSGATSSFLSQHRTRQSREELKCLWCGNGVGAKSS